MAIKTTQDYKKDASKHYQKQAESFERSGTNDGFVSQWASGINAQLANKKAELVKNGDENGHPNTPMAWFPMLFDGERKVNCKVINARYGRSFLLADSEESRYGRKFIPMGSNSRIQHKLGLEQRQELAPAGAVLSGNGTGLSGNVWVEVYRTDKKDWESEDN